MSASVPRARLNTIIVVMICLTALFLVLAPVAGGLALLFLASPPARWFGLLPLAFGMGILWPLLRNNLWVECDGHVLRERRLFTGERVERPLDQIVKITPLTAGLGGFAGMALDAILQNPNRGFIIEFQRGRKISLVRGDVRDIDPLMQKLAASLGERRFAELNSP